jgi:hypothetical protein
MRLMEAKMRKKKEPPIDFMLKATDWTSPETICFWMLLNMRTASEEKLRSAFETAMAMKKNPNKKAAD